MKLKSGDEIMYEGEMFTVGNDKEPYVLLDADGIFHPDGPFTKADLHDCPVK